MVDLAAKIDATLLKNDVGLDEAKDFIRRAARSGFRSVVMFPWYIEAIIRERRPEVRLCTVVSFPHGASTLDSKVREAVRAKEIGVDEIDYVISIPAVKSGLLDEIQREARSMRESFPGVIKAIVEVPILTKDELEGVIDALKGTGIDFLKTSTGLHRPVTPNDVRILKGLSGMRVKASGGIRTRGQAFKLIEAGADVLGTSRPFDLID